jgi:hypothetical protein
MFTWASAMAVEQKAKGTNIMLGPDISILFAYTTFSFIIGLIIFDDLYTL